MTSIRAKQIRFISLLSLIAAIMASFNACFMIFFYGNTFFSYFGFIVAVVFLFCYYLNGIGKDFYAKTIILILFNFAIINISSTQGKGSGSVLLFFPLASLYFLLFESRQWIWIGIWFLLSISGIIGLELSDYNLIRFQTSPIDNLDTLFLVNFALSSLGQILIMSVFMKVSRDLEVGMQLNIEEKEAAIVQLAEAKDNAERAAHARSLFLSSMSHEIRTPLNSIIGFSNLLSEEDSMVAQKEMIQLIQFSSKNLLSIINDILEFNKWEAGKVSIDITTIDLRNLLNKIHSSFTHITQEKQISFEFSIASDLPNLILGDETKLIQLLYNLVSNAIKFTDKGFVKLNVSRKEEDQVRIVLHFEIIDTGIGIAPENLDTIFEQFQQADNSITRRYGGTGLGLSIVKRILNNFDSDIYVESKLGEGTKFYFYLTFSKVDPTSHTSEDSSIDEKKSLHYEKPVLIVDDNDLNISVVSRFLSKWDIPFETATSGLGALTLVQEKKYSIIFMDLQMPEMDGYEATKRILELDSKIPIIALTADTTNINRERLESLGFLGLLQKPFLPEDLFNVLSRYGSKS